MAGGLDPHGPNAAEIAGLWWFLLWLGTAVFLVFMSALVISLVRRRPPGAASPPPPEDQEESARYIRRWVFGLGVAMSTVVLLVVLAVTIAAMREMPHTAAADGLVIDLVAHQWYWEAHYPGHGVTTRGEVRIPAGERVELRLTSADVIHSFWVPALAGKIDALPERTNRLVLQADDPGRYRGQCAEFCGLHHTSMEVAVIALPPEQFTAWLEEGGG